MLHESFSFIKRVFVRNSREFESGSHKRRILPGTLVRETQTSDKLGYFEVYYFFPALMSFDKFSQKGRKKRV